MKNLKKLDRKKLKEISGSALVVTVPIGNIPPITLTLPPVVEDPVCKVYCDIIRSLSLDSLLPFPIRPVQCTNSCF